MLQLAVVASESRIPQFLSSANVKQLSRDFSLQRVMGVHVEKSWAIASIRGNHVETLGRRFHVPVAPTCALTGTVLAGQALNWLVQLTANQIGKCSRWKATSKLD